MQRLKGLSTIACLCVVAAAAGRAHGQAVRVRGLSKGGGAGLASSERPSFGSRRPSFKERRQGVGFRTVASAGRRGLLRRSGLQEAMRAAQGHPFLNPQPAAPSPPPTNPALSQAIQVLRSQQELQNRQLAAEAARRVQRRAPAPHLLTVRLSVPSRRLQTAQVLQQRIDSLAERTAGQWHNVRVRQQGSTTVLEGSVPSADQRRVVELMVRLEPGVYRVDNRLRVEPADATTPH